MAFALSVEIGGDDDRLTPAADDDRIVVGNARLFRVDRLRHCVGMVEEEDSDLLVGLLADVDTAVKTVGRFVPTHLPGTDLEPFALAAVAVFNPEGIAPQDHGNPMKRVAVPVHGLAGGETQPTNKGRSALKESFLGHRWGNCMQTARRLRVGEPCGAP